jgi:hypothetical protein
MGKVNWDINTPVKCWMSAATLQGNDDMYFGWNKNENDMTFWVLCNDIFCGASDAEDLSPEDVLFLVENNYHIKGWREFCQWISDKRGYPKDKEWFCDRKKGKEIL